MSIRVDLVLTYNENNATAVCEHNHDLCYWATLDNFRITGPDKRKYHLLLREGIKIEESNQQSLMSKLFLCLTIWLETDIQCDDSNLLALLFWLMFSYLISSCTDSWFRSVYYEGDFRIMCDDYAE